MLAQVRAAELAETDRMSAVMARAWPYANALRARQPYPPGADPAAVWPVAVPDTVPPMWVPVTSLAGVAA